MKQVKIVLVAFILGIVMIFGVVGCNTVKGTFYTLQEAYDNGWLTQENLQTIANYHHDNSISYPESLSDNIAKSIKRSWAKKLKDDNPETDITEEKVNIVNYYGTYNECVAVIVDRSDVDYPAVYAPVTIEIGGVSFTYNLYHPQIVIFKF